jgi:hypothetical protein
MPFTRHNLTPVGTERRFLYVNSHWFLSVLDGGVNKIYWSTDLDTWTLTNDESVSGPDGTSLNTVTYANGKWFMHRVGSSTTPLTWSTDLSTWHAVTGLPAEWGNTEWGIAYGGGTYVVTGPFNDPSDPRVLYATSTDLTTWTKRYKTAPGYSADVVYRGSTWFFSIYDVGTNVYSLISTTNLTDPAIYTIVHNNTGGGGYYFDKNDLALYAIRADATSPQAYLYVDATGGFVDVPPPPSPFLYFFMGGPAGSLFAFIDTGGGWSDFANVQVYVRGAWSVIALPVPSAPVAPFSSNLYDWIGDTIGITMLSNVGSDLYADEFPLDSTTNNINCPMPTLAIRWGANVHCPKPLLSMHGNTQSATLYAPKSTIAGTGHSSFGENAFFYALPMPTLSARGGANAAIAMPTAKVSIAGTVTNWGHVDLNAPMGTISVTGFGGAVGHASLTTIAPTIIAYAGAVASIAPSDGFTIAARGTSGAVGAASIRMPLFQLTAAGTVRGSSSANLVMPMPRFGATARAHLVMPRYTLEAIGTAVVTTTYEGYAVNLGGESTGQVTHYTNYPFNQIVRFNGHYYGVADDGLYLLEGDMDGTAPIPWAFETCLTDADIRELKRIPSMYIGGRIDGEVDVEVIVGEKSDQSYHYRAVRGANAQSYRVKIGRGLKSRYWAFGMSDTGGSFCEIDAVDLEIQKLERSL